MLTKIERDRRHNSKWCQNTLIEGTICEIGKIVERTIPKTEQVYGLEIRSEKAILTEYRNTINLVKDFVGGYHTKSINQLINLFGERKKFAKC